MSKLDMINHSKILEKLNSIYEKEDSKIDPDILAMQVNSIGKEDWQPKIKNLTSL